MERTEVQANMHPCSTTTTETINWQWPCGTACKMVRQVITCCPHGCRSCQGTPSSRNPPHHHRHHQKEGTWALAAEDSNAGRDLALNPAAPVVAEFWVPDPCLMVQQLREFESLNDEVVALRVQLEEYKDEIEKSKRDNDGRNGWFLALPANIRDVLIMANDAIDSLMPISTPPAK